MLTNLSNPEHDPWAQWYAAHEPCPICENGMLCVTHERVSGHFSGDDTRLTYAKRMLHCHVCGVGVYTAENLSHNAEQMRAKWFEAQGTVSPQAGTC